MRVLGGDMHPAQHGGKSQTGDNRKHHCDGAAQNNLGGERFSGASQVVLPDFPGGDHRETSGTPKGELQEDEHQSEGVIYPRHLISGKGLAADSGVTEGIHLL